MVARGRDPHAALKQDVVLKVNKDGFEVALARLQWGKEEIGFSLHANPSSYTSAGLQRTDFLSYLGFQRSDRYPFTGFNRCYVRWVDEGFNAEVFVEAFQKGFTSLERAESALAACGFTRPAKKWRPRWLSNENRLPLAHRLAGSDKRRILCRATFVAGGGDTGGYRRGAEGRKGWSMTTEKRFCIDCFRSSKPLYPDGDGDQIEYWDTLEEATIRAKKLFAAGGFKLVIVRDSISGEWDDVDQYPA